MTHIIKREELCLTTGLHLAAQDLSRNVSGADANKDLTSFFTVLVSKTKHEKRVQKLDNQPVGFLYVLFRKHGMAGLEFERFRNCFHDLDMSVYLASNHCFLSCVVRSLVSL